MVCLAHPLPTKYEAYGLPRWHHCHTCKPSPFLNRCCCRGLLSSMSEEILHDVVATTTSKEAWDTLQLVVSRWTVGVGILDVAVLKMVRPLVLVLIVVTFLLVLPARSAPKWSILSFAVGHTVVHCCHTFFCSFCGTSNYFLLQDWSKLVLRHRHHWSYHQWPGLSRCALTLSWRWTSSSRQWSRPTVEEKSSRWEVWV